MRQTFVSSTFGNRLHKYVWFELLIFVSCFVQNRIESIGIESNAVNNQIESEKKMDDEDRPNYIIFSIDITFFWFVENFRAKLAEKRKKEDEKKKQEEEKVKEEEEKVGLQFRIVLSAIGICTMWPVIKSPSCPQMEKLGGERKVRSTTCNMYIRFWPFVDKQLNT